jgi:hypothetical protein
MNVPSFLRSALSRAARCSPACVRPGMGIKAITRETATGESSSGVGQSRWGQRWSRGVLFGALREKRGEPAEHVGQYEMVMVVT